MREHVETPSPNHDARSTDVDMLMLHYTGMVSAEAAVARLCDPTAGVSAHYVVDEDGSLLRLVPEERRAWHAGVSFWRGNRDINARSVGIEIVNPGHEFGYRPFPEAQMATVLDLCAEVAARHRVPAWNVVGHADVAPRRKCDPGELFDWRRLAERGIALWPGEVACEADADEGTAAALLSAIGYEVDDLRAALAAFQRHFRPARVDGELDPGTAGLLRAVRRLCP